MLQDILNTCFSCVLYIHFAYIIQDSQYQENIKEAFVLISL